MSRIKGSMKTNGPAQKPVESQCRHWLDGEAYGNRPWSLITNEENKNARANPEQGKHHEKVLQE
jgi:hypothetical protein